MFGTLKLSPRIYGIKIRILEEREKNWHRYRKSLHRVDCKLVMEKQKDDIRKANEEIASENEERPSLWEDSPIIR